MVCNSTNDAHHKACFFGPEQECQTLSIHMSVAVYQLVSYGSIGKHAKSWKQTHSTNITMDLSFIKISGYAICVEYEHRAIEDTLGRYFSIYQTEKLNISWCSWQLIISQTWSKELIATRYGLQHIGLLIYMYKYIYVYTKWIFVYNQSLY